MSYIPGITTDPGAALENTIQPVADTAAGLQIQQHSSGQSAPLLSFYDAAGTTFLGGVGPNASAVWKGLALNVTPRTTNYTTTGTDYYIPVDATAGAVTVTLKPSTGTPFGSQQRVTKVDSSANAVTVQRGGADTINGGTSITLTSQYDTATLQSDGAGAWNAVLSVTLTPAVILAPASSTRNLIQSTGDFIPLTLRGAGGQTQPLQRWQNSTPAVVAQMSVAGALTLGPNSGGVTLQQGVGGEANYLLVYGLHATNFAVDTAVNIPGASGYGMSGGVTLSLTSGLNTAVPAVLVSPSGAASQPFAVRGFAGQVNALMSFQQISSTSTARDAAVLDAILATSTDASRKGRMIAYAADASGINREGWRIESDGSNPMIGFLGATAVVRPSFTTDLRQSLIDLGLYTTGGATPLDLNGGNLKTAGLTIALAAKTANYTLTDADHTVTADATGGAFTVTLPTASGRTGKQYTVKRINSGANAVTLAGNGAETIDGSNTQSLGSQWSSLTVEAATSTTWVIV